MSVSRKRSDESRTLGDSSILLALTSSVAILVGDEYESCFFVTLSDLLTHIPAVLVRRGFHVIIISFGSLDSNA